MVKEATEKGHTGINKILDIMEDCIAEPKKSKSNWPISETMNISISKRAKFIGPGGSNLKKILADTGVQISQSQDDGSQFTLFAPNSDAMKEAKDFIKNTLTEDRIPEFEFGATYEVIITEILDRGAFVQLHPNMKPAFIPNSQLDARKVSSRTHVGVPRYVAHMALRREGLKK